MKKRLQAIDIRQIVFAAVFSLCFGVLVDCGNGDMVVLNGHVRFQEKQQLYVSGQYPVGYYAESNLFRRVYLQHDSIADYLNSEIFASGYMTTIRGQDGICTFPLLVIKKLNEKTQLLR